jgi:hypothetical protein
LAIHEDKESLNREASMTLYILCSCLLVALVVVGAVKLQPWKSGRHMLDVEWMDDSDKFKLIARWGVVG